MNHASPVQSLETKESVSDVLPHKSKGEWSVFDDRVKAPVAQFRDDVDVLLRPVVMDAEDADNVRVSGLSKCLCLCEEVVAKDRPIRGTQALRHHSAVDFLRRH